VEGLSAPKDVVEMVANKAGYYIDEDKFVVVIGGEHSISIGSIKAHASCYEELTILQLDAHSDLREEYNCSIYNHASVMARAKELCPIVQVGIRSMDSSEIDFINKEKVFFAKDIYNKRNWIEKVISKLSKNVYITIDLDVLDPSIMPSTGTPEPGGLLWYDLLKFLKSVFEKREVVGFDITELCPNPRNKAPDFLAAKLIYKLLSYKFGGRNDEE
jgi:agmatinase